MVKRVYEGLYPNHLALKKELNQKGLQPLDKAVAEWVNEKGHTYPLYEKQSVRPLTLADDNAELLHWRDGLRQLTTSYEVEESYLSAIESTIKQRLIIEHGEKDDIRLETLYFKDEYPIDQMEKASQLNRLGLRGIKKVGAYIQGNRCFSLYDRQTARPLTLKNAKKTEKEYWLDGLRQGMGLVSSDVSRESLIKTLEQSLAKPQSSKKSSASRSLPSTTLSYEKLVEQLKKTPDSFLFLNVVGTGIFSHDEVIQLSLIRPSGEIVYHQHFQPKAELIQQRWVQDKVLSPAEWTHEWAKIEPLLTHHTLLIHNSDYDLKLIEQTCQTYRLTVPPLQVIPLMPLIKKQFGYSSLEGCVSHHSWKVNRSELVLNSLLSTFFILSLFLPEAEVFQKKQEAEQVFHDYCHQRQSAGVLKAKEKGWHWIQQSLHLHPSIQSFDVLDTNHCSFVVEQLRPLVGRTTC